MPARVFARVARKPPAELGTLCESGPAVLGVLCEFVQDVLGTLCESGLAELFVFLKFGICLQLIVLLFC